MSNEQLLLRLNRPHNSRSFLFGNVPSMDPARLLWHCNASLRQRASAEPMHGLQRQDPLPPFLAEQILSLDGDITLLLHLWVKILLSKNHGNEHHTHAVDIALLSVTTLLHLRRQVRSCPCILRHRMLGIKVARQVEIGQFPLVLP